MLTDFSFIILTYNEEIHLGRLLESIVPLGAPLFILDSGSTDATLDIARHYGAEVKTHAFETHPKQWDFALNNFNISTPWTIGLDADQEVSEKLRQRLLLLRNEEIPADVNGIYFNRHNYFKGSRLRYGGYRNKYLMKMFRTGVGHSDLSENMDHRFIVPGKTMIWKDGILKEENLKENEISFWLNKHNAYSDRIAQEEIERKQALRRQQIKPKLLGNPDQRIAFFKKIWWDLPLYFRPLLYFFYRFVIRLGCLDGKNGRIFHFLQAFWFRLIVDIKIQELESDQKNQ